MIKASWRRSGEVLPLAAVDPLRAASYNPALRDLHEGGGRRMEAGHWHRCLKLSLAEGALATAMGTLQSGVFLMGFALLLGASPLVLGLLAALPALAQLAQLVGAAWMERHGG